MLLKKGKKGQNIRKFEQKCKKFENILKKGIRWPVITATCYLLSRFMVWDKNS